MNKKTHYEYATAIVPAYNEAKNIEYVLQTLKKCPLINQIIVVDDGSQDKTSLIARHENATLLKHKKNEGKSEAIKTAIPFIKNEVVFLCDADLLHLKHEDCIKIINPIINKEAEMSVGMRNYGPIFNRIAMFYPSISGERALTKSLLEAASKSKYFYDYGTELVLHYYCKSKNLIIEKHPYSQNHVPLIKKLGLINGIKKSLKQISLLIRVSLAMKIYGWH